MTGLMQKQFYIIVFLIGILGFPQGLYAQVDFNKRPDDDLGNVSDEYQELFFEALKQKGIENFDRAVEILRQCENLDNSDPALYFELGKNYNKLKNFQAAETALKIAVERVPDNEWFLDELYEVYAQQNDLDKAIGVVKQLVQHHPDYKEDLATLYYKTKQYEEAMRLIDELDQEFGYSETRDRVRNMIYNATGQTEERIENLESRLNKDPDEERNYLSLIYRYSENNEKDKAFETAKKLLEINPNSHLVHLALYKFYLDREEPEKAVSSMEIVLNSSEIKPKAKLMVLTDFVNFVGENPEYESKLVEITSKVSQDGDLGSNLEIAQYFLDKDEKGKALYYYEQALNSDPDNYAVLQNVLLLYIDLGENEIASNKSQDAMDRFPSQPLFYLIQGVAQNKLNAPNKAIRALESGLDYIIDDPKMERDFYRQLSISYTLLNNTAKAKTFSDKAKELESSN